MILDKLELDIKAIQAEIGSLADNEASEQDKADVLQSDINKIYAEIGSIRLKKRNLEIKIQALLTAQNVLQGYDLDTLEPSPVDPDTPADQTDDPVVDPPGEDGFYPIPDAGNLDDKKVPIGIYDGQNIYDWFYPDANNYWTHGELVKYPDGVVYRSVVNAPNTWSPEAYPAGWEAIGRFDIINER